MTTTMKCGTKAVAMMSIPRAARTGFAATTSKWEYPSVSRRFVAKSTALDVDIETEGELPSRMTEQLSRATASVDSDNAEQVMYPGDLDTLNGFTEGESVSFWRKWRWDGNDEKNGLGLTGLRNMMAAKLASNPVQGSSYVSYHALRTSFFLLNAYAGLFVADLAKSGAGEFIPGSVASLSGGALSKALPSLGYNIGEVSAMYMQDYNNIEKNIYKNPYDMSFRHQQFNPLFVASKMRNFIREATDTLQRRTEQRADDVWLTSKLYPQYYLNTWHYQTDGWMSSESAEVYETSTETLFLGRQDAMQRQTLVPLSSFVKEKNDEGISSGSLKLAEVGCGTGRAMTFILDNYPELQFYVSELSPFYLQKARKNVQEWKRVRQPTVEPKTTFVQAAAEDLPFEDESMDVIVNIYMFHELEVDVLKQVVREMGRVLKPGGMVILTDSIQLGDRPMLDANLGNFKAFNEPNYVDYINLDLGSLFKNEGGLLPHTKELGSSTKVLSFRKPLVE